MVGSRLAGVGLALNTDWRLCDFNEIQLSHMSRNLFVHVQMGSTHPVTLFDLEADDWIDPSLPSNMWALSRSKSEFVPLEPRGPFEVSSMATLRPEMLSSSPLCASAGGRHWKGSQVHPNQSGALDLESDALDPEGGAAPSPAQVRGTSQQ